MEAGELEPKSNSRACGPAVVGAAPHRGYSREAAGRRGRSPGGAAGGQRLPGRSSGRVRLLPFKKKGKGGVRSWWAVSVAVPAHRSGEEAPSRSGSGALAATGKWSAVERGCGARRGCGAAARRQPQGGRDINASARRAPDVPADAPFSDRYTEVQGERRILLAEIPL